MRNFLLLLLGFLWMACSLCAKSPLGLTFFPGRTATGYATVQIGNETVTATLEHPFWVENVGWVGAGALQPGEWVKTLDGGDQAVVSVQTFAGEIKVYNFEVENTHAYFVSGAGLLVHNQSSVRSINQTNQAIQKGQAPKGVTRADKGLVKGEQDNIHFSDGTAVNRDGSFKHGGRSLTNTEKDFLRESGFTVPE